MENRAQFLKSINYPPWGDSPPIMDFVSGIERSRFNDYFFFLEKT